MENVSVAHKGWCYKSVIVFLSGNMTKCTQPVECGGLSCCFLYHLFLLRYFINVITVSNVFNVNRYFSQTSVPIWKDHNDFSNLNKCISPNWIENLYANLFVSMSYVGPNLWFCRLEIVIDQHRHETYRYLHQGTNVILYFTKLKPMN